MDRADQVPVHRLESEEFRKALLTRIIGSSKAQGVIVVAFYGGHRALMFGAIEEGSDREPEHDYLRDRFRKVMDVVSGGSHAVVMPMPVGSAEGGGG